jgi:hypothetical protein
MDEDKRNLMKINKHKLDEEAMQISLDYYDSYKLELNAIDFRDRSKKHMEDIMHVIELDLRSLNIEQINEKYSLNLTKITDPTIKALVSKSDEVKDASAVYYGWKAEAGRLKAIRESLDRKYGMLEMLSYLYKSGYFMKASFGEDFENKQHVMAGKNKDTILSNYQTSHLKRLRDETLGEKK